MRGKAFACLGAVVASCHLVSGVHELEYVDAVSGTDSTVSTGAGGPCEDAQSCASTHCVDGVCCESACDAPCSSCAETGSEGTCSLYAVGTDPEGECTSGSCDATGTCVGANYVFGTTLPELTIFDMAVRDDGGFLVVGEFTGTIDLGKGPLASIDQDILVARFSATGECVWSKKFGETGADVARGVAIDKYGYVWLTGEIGGSMSFGGGTLTPNGPSDFFLAKLDAMGNHAFSQAFEAIESDTGWDVEIVGDDVFVLGTHSPYLQLPDISSEPYGGLFLARFDDDGNPWWARTYSADAVNSLLQVYQRLAVSAEGDCVITGGFEGEIAFPDEVRTADDGVIDGYLARVDVNGNFGWSKRFAIGTQFAPYPDVAVDAGGNVYVAGHFFDTTDLESGVLTSAGDSDIFLASFAPDGAARWSRPFGDTAKQEAHALAVDSEGTLVMTGMVQGKVDFGAGELSTLGQDAFLVRFAADGTHLFSAVYGNNSVQHGDALAIHARSLLVAGHCEGAMDFGGGSKTCNGAFVAGFSP